ncbi:hypothetical protein SNE26_25580 [Mucilaginibacter sp. cycad4]|uniref:hypothetical protein n=1 Tax=Mucilaginibacter sp. cycad4 TaxID=3342096 RepID=UPI002AAB5096|nr:hypothetical protein [Mucilaginibacter gossypii]WPU99389.1 hypothetical protein SNE26_25580 [Mucilaginibacter gossypii]
MMKRIFTCIFILTGLFAYGQKIKVTQLEYVDAGTILKENQAIIYGSFIQRLTFWQNGYQQTIRIRNLETNELFSFEVKPNLRTRKENPFCFFIKPGTYEIVNFYYSKGKWYGVEYNTRPVFRGLDFEINVKNKVDSGLIKWEDLHRIVFKVDNSKLTYLGQWHFESGPPSFSDNKTTLDKKLKEDYYFLEFEKAAIVLPY